MSATRTRAVPWLLLMLLCVGLTTLALTVVAASTCTGTVCTPYVTLANGGVSCLRKNPMNLRFVLEMATENRYTIGSVVHGVATYGFNPCVDMLSSFSLPGAPFLSSAYTVTEATSVTAAAYAFTSNQSDKYLSVYGFGMSNQTVTPQHGVSAGAVVIAKNGNDACGDPSAIGLVTVLSLNIGMHNGFFNYVGQSAATTQQVANPNYDPAMCDSSSSSGTHKFASASSSSAIDYCSKYITKSVSAVNVQPAKVGFTPTCNAKDECIVGDPDSYVCIGNVSGQKNCGLCYTNATALATNSSLTVWVSYYGTDRNRVTLVSSGDNPLNYVNFVRNGAFTTVVSKFKSLFRGNFSVVGL